MSWTRLWRNNFSFSRASWRRLEDFSKDVLKMSWRRPSRKTKNCYAEDAFKTSGRYVLKTSWRYIFKTCSRHLGDKQNVYWGYLYLTNVNMYLTNLYFTNLYLTNLRWIQNNWLEPNNFNIRLILKLKQHILRIKISHDCWCCEINWIQIRHCRTGEAIKTKLIWYICLVAY